jgi:ABC-type branched-subunit amino acid transport system substrate-binding protein
METTLSRKADTAVYVDEDDDRFEAALRLAEDDPARGAGALRTIVADDAFDPDTRFEAAARLAEVDEALAAEALRSIVADDAFDPDTRSEAAARLAEIS